AAGTLREMIDRTLFAVSSDETRFNLSGVFLSNEDDGLLRMVATDGHRLALIDRRLPSARMERGVVMPRQGLIEARKALGEASEEVDVQYTGEPLTIGFNARYLMDVLAVHAEGDAIELGFTDEVGPGVVRGSQDPEYTYVVMPMRL